MTVQISPIFYPQALQLWQSVCRLPYSFFLDSCSPYIENEWSFLGWSPSLILVQYADQCRTITAQSSENDSKSIFELASECQRKRQERNQYSLPFDIPFTGGMVGFFGYEAARFLGDFDFMTPSESPLAVVAFYDQGVAIHHTHQSAWHFENASDTPRIYPISIGDITASKMTSGSGKRLSACETPFNEKMYSERIQTLKTSIQNGDIYQANISHRYSATGKLDPIQFYQVLRSLSPAPRSAFLNFGGTTIFSSSPERFFKIKNGTITCNPIKGTRPRHLNSDIDAKLKIELAQSDKENAELVMITDMIRNDLGRICIPGSIQVPELKAVKSFAQVHHLESTIVGTLPDKPFLEDVFKALFPGGSITGAPKIKATKLIAQLETCSRQVYTGSIGYWADSGNAEFNIAIRTMYGNADRWYFHAGGGIVADSDPKAEWQETLDKAAGILAAVRYYNTHVPTPSLRFS